MDGAAPRILEKPEERFLTDSREHLARPCAAHEDAKSSADKDCRERSGTAVENLTTPKQLGAPEKKKRGETESRNV